MNESEILRHFFATQFHQDWDAEGAQTWKEVVDAYLAANDRQSVERVAQALRTWAGPRTNDDINGRLLAEFDCYYDSSADGLAAKEWVLSIADRLSESPAHAAPRGG